MARIAPRPDLNVLSKTKAAVGSSGHRPFQEFRVATLDDLVKQLETNGQGVDVLTVQGVPHLVCGKLLANILIQTDASRHMPCDLLAIYQYCQECKVAVRVL